MSLPARHSRGDIPAAKTLKKQIRDESAAGHRQTASVLSPFNGRTSAPLREVSGNSLPEPFSIITHSGNRLSIGHTAPAGVHMPWEMGRLFRKRIKVRQLTFVQEWLLPKDKEQQTGGHSYVGDKLRKPPSFGPADGSEDDKAKGFRRSAHDEGVHQDVRPQCGSRGRRRDGSC